MKYTKGLHDSYCHNCFLKRRSDDPCKVLVHNHSDFITISLNGYAIIPIEEYEELTGIKGVNTREKVKQADKDLWGSD